MLTKSYERAFSKGTVEQFNGREGETVTFLSRCPLNSNLRGGGFAPRHLSRYVSVRVLLSFGHFVIFPYFFTLFDLFGVKFWLFDL